MGISERVGQGAVRWRARGRRVVGWHEAGLFLRGLGYGVGVPSSAVRRSLFCPNAVENFQRVGGEPAEVEEFQAACI